MRVSRSLPALSRAVALLAPLAVLPLGCAPDAGPTPPNFATAEPTSSATGSPLRSRLSLARHAALHHRLRLEGCLRSEGLEVAVGAQADRLRISLVRWGRTDAWRKGGASHDLASGCVASGSSAGQAGGRLTVEHQGLLEHWDARAMGLEHSFVVEARPPGEGPLSLVLATPGARVQVDASGEAAVLRTPAGRTFHYRGLMAWDASGRRLPAHLGAAESELALVVEDAGAAYPLTIDPLLTSPSWATEGNQASADYGFSVAGAGDVNGDGYDDVVVGAPRLDSGANLDVGGAFVYLGSSAGLGTTAGSIPTSSLGADTYFGFSVAVAGDVDDDGYDDVLIGAPRYDGGEQNEGAAFLFFGGRLGLVTVGAWTVESDQAGAFFGYSVASAGDVNGDGYDDILVGARYYNNGEANEGRAFVYLGGDGGPSTTAAWTAESNQQGARFGRAVASAGDVNGDGFDDVLVGAPRYDNGETDEGRAFLYLGSASGLSSTPAWTAESDQPDAWFGDAVAGAGDVNGDGFDDVLVGAPRYDNGETDEGAAFLYLGSAAGLSTTPAWVAEGDQAGADLGSAVAGAGDLDGDGYDDVVIGAQDYDGAAFNGGRVLVYLGSATGLAPAPVWTAESGQASASLGFSVAAAGDVSGDGRRDLIVGAPGYSNGELSEGQAVLYEGCTAPDSDGDGLCDLVDNCPAVANPAQTDT
ncbi:MAG: hypothetical protein D6729_12065, partial [Deltaproteobacteria bacterium]